MEKKDETGMVVNGKPVRRRSLNWSSLTPAKMAGLLVILFAAITIGVVATSGNNNTVKKISPVVATTDITSSGLVPSTITVDRGQQVTWTNTDADQHRLQADTQLLPGFDSGTALKTGDSYTYTFQNSGTYHYYDPNNVDSFTGTVIVE